MHFIYCLIWFAFFKFLFHCAIAVPFQFVRWLRDDVAIVDSRHPELFPPPRITLFTNGSLQVREVQRNDTAEYLCEVMTASHVPETQLHAIEVQCKFNATPTTTLFRLDRLVAF